MKRVTDSKLSSSFLEKILWVITTLCFGFCFASLFLRVSARKEADAYAAVRPQKQDSSQEITSHIETELRIRDLGVAVPVFAGCSFINLEKGACHLAGSATFGGLGNAAVAGHRDRDFRKLDHIRKGMNISISQDGKCYEYIVDSTEIVFPDNVQVLAIHDRPELTLITCYPFYYVGPAPKRFIVHAHLVSLS